MKWAIVVDSKARKALKKMPTKDADRIATWIDALEAGEIKPRDGDVKKLKRYPIGYRKRIGSYRILFDIFEDEIVIYVVDVRRRSTVTYK